MIARKLILAFLVAMLAFGIAACEQDGPMEEAGETADETAEDAGEAAEDMGESMEEGAEETGEQFED